MALKIQYEFLFVGRDEGSFVENYAYDLGEGGDNSGKIYINLEIQNNPLDAEMVGETIFDTMRRVFFADPENDPYERFEDAVRAVNHALQDLKESKVSKYLGTMHIIISAVVGDKIFVTLTGDSEAYIIRRRLCSPVTNELHDPDSVDVFAHIANGTIEDGDVILFGTTKLLRYINKTELSQICSGQNLVASLAELKDYLMTEVLGKVGLIGVSVQETAPDLSDVEKGKIVEHLEKEEYYSERAERSEGGSRGSDMKSRLKNVDFKGKVAGLGKNVKELKIKMSGMRRATKAGIARTDSDWLNVKNWSKDRILGVAILLIIFSTLGVLWLKGRANEQEQIAKYAAMLAEVQDRVNSAETTGQYNKDQAGEILNVAEQSALEVLNSGFHRGKANELLTTIQMTKDRLDGVIRPEVRKIADLTEKRSNVSALGMVSMDDTLYVYEYNALYPIVLDQLSDPLTIDENEKVIDATVYDDKGSLLFYTRSGKLIEYKDNRITFLDTSDESFKKGVAIEAYGHYLYVLDPEQNQIWKYSRGRDNFSGAEAWNVNADVKDGISFGIDGNIYVLHKDGVISKIFRGDKQDFPIKKQPVNSLEMPLKLFTEAEMSNIYILEPEYRRVLVYYKDDRTGGAIYASQLVFEDLDDLRDIYVDKDTNTLYLLDKTSVYEVTL